MKFVLLGVLLFLTLEAHAAPAKNQAGVQIQRDIVFSRLADHTLKFDLLRPEKLPAKALPLVLYFHGGAWRSGSHHTLSPTLFKLARMGFAVASIEFRGSDEAIFPAPLDDGRAALRFWKQNFKKYSVNPQKIGVYGVSTGAHLAGLLGYTSSSIGAIALQSAPSDLATLANGSRVDWNDADSPLGAFLGVAPSQNPVLAQRASPLFFADESAPPTLLLHGADDSFVRVAQSEKLYQKLKKAGTSVEFIEFEGEGHDLKGAQNEVEKAIMRFFGKWLK